MMKLSEIGLATENPGKRREFELLFNEFGIKLYEGRSLTFPEEIGSDYLTNALAKARFAAKAWGVPCIGDDSGIEVAGLNDLPGPFSARLHHFTEKQILEGVRARTLAGVELLHRKSSANPDEDNMKLLLDVMRAKTGDQRLARFVACLALANPEGDILFLAHGCADGRLTRTPMGSNGFGYDPIMELFACPGRHCAELSLAEKSAVSHRGQAMRKLAQYLAR